MVTLTSSDKSEVRVPASVTIPAGQLTAAFSLTVEDDAILDGTRFATVTAAASGYGQTQTTIAVADNETAVISLSAPDIVWEGAGAFTGTVQLSAPPAEAVGVVLASSHPNAVQVPPFVVLQSGQTSVDFTRLIPDNHRIDGTQVVTVSATVVNWTPGSTLVTVFDNEANVLTLDVPAQIREGDGPQRGTVGISGTLSADLVVTLSANEPTEIQMPATVTILAGFSSAVFNIKAIDDTERDGAQNTEITASAAGFPSASAPVRVLDNLDSSAKCNTWKREGKKERVCLGGTWFGGRAMSYTQLNLIERCTLAGLHGAGWGDQEIGEYLGRSRTTIWRERRRNRAPYDGLYRAERAQERAVARRRRSRRNGRIGARQWKRVEGLLREEQWSPGQIAGYLRETGEMKISHERIYQHVWKDRERGGRLWEHLRGARKQRRKRYGSQDSRGRLAGKRAIGERPAVVEKRARVGDWEIDTVHGSGKACVVTLVERQSGYVVIGKLAGCTVEQTNGRTQFLRNAMGASS